MLLYRTTGRWCGRCCRDSRRDVVRLAVRVFLEGAESLGASLSTSWNKRRTAHEEGIEGWWKPGGRRHHRPEQAGLIEQVVEFSDKRVRE